MTLGQSRKVLRLATLRQAWSGCTECENSRTRSKVIFSRGSVDSKIVLIGDGPDRLADAHGRPCIGRAGNKLSEVLEAAGIEDPFVMDAIGCRMFRDHRPSPVEVNACSPRTNEMLRIISPTVVVTMGEVAFHALGGMSGHETWRGQPLDGYIPGPRGTEGMHFRVVPTYHPRVLGPSTGRLQQQMISDMKVARSVASSVESDPA